MRGIQIFGISFTSLVIFLKSRLKELVNTQMNFVVPLFLVNTTWSETSGESEVMVVAGPMIVPRVTSAVLPEF